MCSQLFFSLSLVYRIENVMFLKTNLGCLSQIAFKNMQLLVLIPLQRIYDILVYSL